MRWRAIAVAGVAVGGLVLVSPAVGAAILPGSGDQPPPGAKAVKVTETEPVPEQPGADAKASKVTEVAPVPNQPANAKPEAAGKPTQVKGPAEKKKGVNGADTSAKRKDGGTRDGADKPGGRKD